MKTLAIFAALLIILSAEHPAADAAQVTVALSGDVAPGTSDSFTGFSVPALNNAGQTAFAGGLNSSSASDSGIWSEGGGSGLALVAREGNTAPGTSDKFVLFNSPVLNNAGQTAFSGRLNSSSGTDSGIWSEGGGSGLALVARWGNTAPGTSDSFRFLNSPVLNSAGQTAFVGGLNSSAGTDRGIWAEDLLGVLTLIAREGDLLDVDDGSGTDLRTISRLSFIANTGNGDGRASGFNDLGQLAFLARFTDGTSGVFLSDLVAIPEPSSVVLSALGLFGLLATRRRKK